MVGEYNIKVLPIGKSWRKATKLKVKVWLETDESLYFEGIINKVV